MTFMLCPICQDKVYGGGLEELSQSFQDHLRDEHDMKHLRPPSEGKVLRPVYDAHDRDAMGTRWQRPDERVAIIPEGQGVTDIMVRCPFCASIITGRSENDLGVRMGDHWSNEHDILPQTKPSILKFGGGRK